MGASLFHDMVAVARPPKTQPRGSAASGNALRTIRHRRAGALAIAVARRASISAVKSKLAAYACVASENELGASASPWRRETCAAAKRCRARSGGESSSGLGLKLFAFLAFPLGDPFDEVLLSAFAKVLLGALT